MIAGLQVIFIAIFVLRVVGHRGPLPSSLQTSRRDLYHLGEEASAFFESRTGVEDDMGLKEHILTVQTKPYAFVPYPCIRILGFTRLRISKFPAYSDVLALGREREDTVLPGTGFCCTFGNDVCKAVVDGFPRHNLNSRVELWDFGDELFKSTSETFPAHFMAGDALEPSMLEIIPPRSASDNPETPRPNLSTLTSLNHVHRHVSAIHASSFFHLFTEEKRLRLARAFAGLLSPLSGSVIFGAHIARLEEKGLLADEVSGQRSEMWDTVFEKGSVSVKGHLRAVTRDGETFWVLVWLVTRLEVIGLY
ncbi:hypothetical protein BV22DRAFT_1015839 [Leucogyrophana mollusca]|uniref:Uncharacterized protein n=1 Tax=Leucogyrophana mollusca TaxID=85980 RepID=A0ACB8BBL9_9AGAM|nr:hypothetical protein BV22DRAFT_1015839 [Leucogyrophana mollusca]